jgi:hypothetical protein
MLVDQRPQPTTVTARSLRRGTPSCQFSLTKYQRMHRHAGKRRPLRAWRVQARLRGRAGVEPALLTEWTLAPALTKIFSTGAIFPHVANVMQRRVAVSISHADVGTGIEQRAQNIDINKLHSTKKHAKEYVFES